MAEQPLSVRFEYTTDDYVEGWRAGEGSLKPAKLRLSWGGHATFAITGLVGGPLIMFANPGNRFAMILGSGVLGLGIWYMYGLSVQLWRYHFGIRRGFKKLESFHGHWEMQFSEVGLRIRGPRASSDTSWEFFKTFVETPNVYVLSCAPGYIIVPKKAFLPAQLASFRELISKKLVAVNAQYDQRDFFIALAVAVAVLVLLYVALRLAFG